MDAAQDIKDDALMHMELLSGIFSMHYTVYLKYILSSGIKILIQERRSPLKGSVSAGFARLYVGEANAQEK